MALRSLYKDEKYSDLTVSCGPRTFKLHRAVVCPQSPFFEKACSGGFKESVTGCIDIQDDDPATFEKLVEFLYTGSYTDGFMQFEEDQENTVLLFSAQAAEAELSLASPRFQRRRDDDDQEIDEADSDERNKSVYDPTPRQFLKEHSSITNYQWKRVRSDPDVRPMVLQRGLLVSARVYTIADKFLVPALKLLALHRLGGILHHINNHYGTDLEFRTLARIYKEAPPDYVLQEVCVRFIEYQLTHRRVTDDKWLKDITGPLAEGFAQYTALKRYWRSDFRASHWMQAMMDQDSEEEDSSSEGTEI